MPDQIPTEIPNILVIDDQRVIGDALKVVLESHGHDVVVVENGREGIKQVAGRRFSFAIVDLFLPGISGLRTIKTIRELQPELKVILITGQGTPRAFAEARRLGVVGILAKPFRPVDILDLIARVMRG
jgi:DNA-binding NtrC family response regulator